MSTMNRRTTFALDEETIRRLKKLASLWQVSQAEVVRKAVEKAEKDLGKKTTDKIERLRSYHDKKSLDVDTVDTYLDEVAENRAVWGRD